MSYKLFLSLVVALSLGSPYFAAESRAAAASAPEKSNTTASAPPANNSAGKPSAAAGAKGFKGNVSWYGVPFHGRKTASGEIFNMNKLSAAHLKLPFKTRVMVEDPKTGKTVVVKVNDRGPYACKRVMDLSKQAATNLGTISRGVAYVECTVVDDDD